MASFKSRIFNFMLRNNRVFQFKKRKETFDFNTSIADFRDKCEKGAEKFGNLIDGIANEKVSLSGINCEWLIPAGAKPEKMVMYVHGGGYVSGSCNDHRAIVSKFVKNYGVGTLTYEYRLAPEYPFPAGLEDSIVVYKQLLEKGFKPENIMIVGESAGGGLTLALLLALRDKQIPLPKAAVAISPWTDLTCSSSSYKTKNKLSVAPIDSWYVFSKYYCGDNDPKNPYISPLFGDLKGLPPIYINSGEADELYEDGEKFYKKAKSAGVDVIFQAGIGQLHCYPLLAPFFPEATSAMKDICDFIKKHLG